MACIASEAPSAIRELRNHATKTIGKPCAGKPHARIERGMGKQTRTAGTAPLTTNDRGTVGLKSKQSCFDWTTPSTKLFQSQLPLRRSEDTETMRLLEQFAV